MELEKLVRNEVAFCEENEFVANKNGAFIYESQNKEHMIFLPVILLNYKEWLIDKKIVKAI